MLGNKRSTSLALVLLTGIGFTLVAEFVEATTLYRWNDARGNPVISDRPPEAGIPYTKVDGARYGLSASSSIKAPKPMPTPKAEATAVTGAAAGVIVDEPAPRQKASKEVCDQVTADIERLETFARIRTQNPETGEIYFLSESEKASRLEQAKTFKDNNCD